MVLNIIGDLFGWIPVPVDDSRIANVIRAAIVGGLVLLGIQVMTRG